MTSYQRIKLPYQLDELEPIISSRTMYYHYQVLHQNYQLKLAETLKGTTVEKQFFSLEQLMENLTQLPGELQADVRFFGGGLLNHNFFFAHLTKKSDHPTEKISPALLTAIKKEFTNWKNCREKLIASACQVRGSGWTWLVLNAEKKLTIINTANQDGPWLLAYSPLIAIDVWEHAYFLDYETDRRQYVEKLLNHCLNWEYISRLYALKTS